MTASADLPAPPRLPLRLEDGGDTYTLVRAWPRNVDHMLVEMQLDDGSTTPPTVVGQWFADPEALAAAAQATPAPARVVGPVLLQPDGADAQLPALVEVLAEPGARLVGHRPGRRAVVQVAGSAGNVFVKIVRRPRRAADVVRRGELVQTLVGDEVVVPELVGSDLPRGVVRWGDVGGRTLYDLGASWSPGQARQAWEQAGHAVAALHGADVELVDDRHEDEDEVAGADRWLRPAVVHGRFDADLVGQARERVVEALAELPPTPALGVLHRDVHDKQVLLRPDGRIAMIDVDTLAVGERAVDLANVLVHLELRQAQGLITAEAATAAWSALRTGLIEGATARGEQDVAERAWERLPAYALACRLRMAAIYSFRPPWHDVAEQMLTAVAAAR